MFKKTTPQSTIFSSSFIFDRTLPNSDWCYIYRDKVLPLINEEKFRHLFAEGIGAPNKPVKTVVSILLFMGLEKLTWREAEFHFERRLDWFVATDSQIGANHIDHTTLFKFYQRLGSDETAYNLFLDITLNFIETCKVSTAKQRTDSFFVHGWLKILSRYGLIKETVRAFLKALKKHGGDAYEKIRNELSKDYLEKTFDLTEKNRDRAQRKIKEMAKDMFLLRESFRNDPVISKYETFRTLEKVFKQQCEVVEKEDEKEKSGNDGDGNGGGGMNKTGEVTVREKPLNKDGDGIISSPHNTDAEYVRKVNQKVVGHKALVTETCGESNEVQFATDVTLTRSTRADSKETMPMLERQEKNGTKPESCYGDAGFVTGENIVAAEKLGTSLEGPTPGRSQDVTAYDSKKRALDASDFKVKRADGDWDLLECPGGYAPYASKPSRSGDHRLFYFKREECLSCPLQSQCFVTVGKRAATLKLSEAQYVSAERHREYMENEDYRKSCSTRAAVEGTVNEIANGHGVRKARHFTSGLVRLQVIFAASAMNIKRFIRHQQEKCAKNLKSNNVYNSQPI